MRISEITDLRVALLGFGVEGRATLRCLRNAGLRQPVAVLGDTPPSEGADALQVLGATYRADGEVALAESELLIRSPGFPPHHPLRVLAERFAVRQTTATDLFMHEARARGIQVVGLTGSKGKSTTSALLQAGLVAAGRPTMLVGNIGVPALECLEQLSSAGATAVMELSSYQCDDLTLGPDIACLLSLFPEHMDHHGGIAAYYGAKLRLPATQRPGDRFFYAAACKDHVKAEELPGVCEVVGEPAGLHYRAGGFYRGAQRLCVADGMRLPGLHNRYNACMALRVMLELGESPAAFQQALGDFGGLPFRLQAEGRYGGVQWVNDAISTAPEATAAALQAFPETTALIVGGYDRGYCLDPLLEALQDSAVRYVATVPLSGPHIAQTLRDAGVACEICDAPDLAAAVAWVARRAAGAGLCLFSPGAPSYGVYKDFAERGRAFTALLKTLGQNLG